MAAAKVEEEEESDFGSPRSGNNKAEALSPPRKYQFTNLKDLNFDEGFTSSSPLRRGAAAIDDASPRTPSVLPFFIQNDRFRATAVLEESVIDNECIKQTAFLKNFDPRFVDEILDCRDCVRAIVYLPNQVIVRQGEKGDSMMVIAKGVVEVSVDGCPIKRLGEGSFFGELVFVGATDNRTATITAVTFCDVRLIYRAAFNLVLQKYPAMQQYFKELVQARLDTVQRDAQQMMRQFTKKFSAVKKTRQELQDRILSNSARGTSVVAGGPRKSSARGASRATAMPALSDGRAGTGTGSRSLTMAEGSRTTPRYDGGRSSGLRDAGRGVVGYAH